MVAHWSSVRVPRTLSVRSAPFGVRSLRVDLTPSPYLRTEHAGCYADPMAQSTTSTLLVTCPDCGGRLEVDRTSGAVVKHATSETKAPKDFDRLLARIDDDRLRAEKLAAQEEAALENRQSRLDARFEEILGRVDDADDGTPPESPFDLD